MKIISIVSLFLIFSQFSYGAEVCTNVPDAIEIEKVLENFDGSKTFIVPKVYVEGEYRYIFGEVSATGFCNFMAMDFVVYKSEIKQSYHDAALLDKDGNYYGLKTTQHFITKVTCRKP